MSDKKKVIHVKDLVIKADNVHIEPRRPHRYDPFFGGRRMDEQHESAEAAGDERENEHEHADESEDRDNRGPFSWI
ncbi:hypothetical protein F3157_16435 [Virgibacillus dakarensis]|uniref:Uncharacterized protein n=1 Tax=Lentibacillus populi TaxID=1827502 RepID=A0A9W5X5L6_9BACI|nr:MULTISPECIES: hypothetical protein [Bacillaceae]MBT2215456.1 hypothetical protein [Virgibacillus dakarensis]MTW87228.1 hypothetical protein [Virgibacillus dakarensis]GGB40347.1 hypothetical protein GCM10011409_17360 [Lentibacillus populi]